MCNCDRTKQLAIRAQTRVWLDECFVYSATMLQWTIIRILLYQITARIDKLSH